MGNQDMVRGRLRSKKWNPVFALAIAVVTLGACSGLAGHPAGQASGGTPHPLESLPPPSAGYFTLRPVGSYKSLPDDAVAAAKVHRSGWEPRPGNARYNGVVPSGLDLPRAA